MRCPRYGNCKGHERIELFRVTQGYPHYCSPHTSFGGLLGRQETPTIVKLPGILSVSGKGAYVESRHHERKLIGVVCMSARVVRVYGGVNVEGR